MKYFWQIVWAGCLKASVYFAAALAIIFLVELAAVPYLRVGILITVITPVMGIFILAWFLSYWFVTADYFKGKRKGFTLFYDMSIFRALQDETWYKADLWGYYFVYVFNYGYTLWNFWYFVGVYTWGTT